MVKRGHIEDFNQHLYIYGDALDILDNERLQRKTESITFLYIHIAHITTPAIADKLCKFRKLRALHFRYNHMTTIRQILDIDRLLSASNYKSHIRNQDVTGDYGQISIRNNKLCEVDGFRPWMIFKFHKTQMMRIINDEFITDELFASLMAEWNEARIFFK